MTSKTTTNKAEKFKSKGSNILKRPRNMEGFLKDSPITQIHKTTIPQKHIPLNKDKHRDPNALTRYPSAQEKLGRLHIQIRQDLIDQLLDKVFKRKRDSKVNKRAASQRAIVEEALERYFENETNLQTDQT
jgi:hypothetical protein